MNVFCPSCGHRFDTIPPPHDPDGVVSCPKCLSTFATSGLAAVPAVEPRRKLKKKPAKSAPVGPILAGLVAVLLAGGAGVYFAFFRNTGTTATSSSHTTPVKPLTKPDGTPVPTATAPAEWSEFASDEGKFKVLSPGALTRKKRAKDVSYELDTGDLVLGVIYADVGSQAADKAMSDARDALVKQGGKLVRETPVTLGIHKGREFIVDLPGRGNVHQRYFVVNKRLYSLIVLGKSAPPSDRDVARFFESFQVTG